MRGPPRGPSTHCARRPRGERVLPDHLRAGGGRGRRVPLHHPQAQGPQPQNLRPVGPRAPRHLREDAPARLHLLPLESILFIFISLRK